MRYVSHCAVIFWLALGCACHAEDADADRLKGIQALKDSQSNPHAVVEAARCFARAAESFAKAGDEARATEMNSFLFWCKKKMTYQDIEQFTKGGESTVAAKLFLVEKIKPEADEAAAWFDRAEKFAAENPGEHFLIAVRFFEVASRFVGTKSSIAAQERSLAEQALAREAVAASPAPATAPSPAPAKPNPVENNDPIKKRLHATKAQYTAELENARKGLLDAFAKREADARRDGNKKAVDQVKEERAAFEAKKASEQLPSFSAENRRKTTAAWKALAAEYEATIKEFTKAGKDDDANAVEKEYHAAMDENAASQAEPSSTPSAPPPAHGVRDKTFVVWLTIGNLKQQAMGVMTIEDKQGHHDALVFAEIVPGKWMAGSESFVRTQKDQKKNALETAGPNTPIQLAVSYKERDVTIYRNGQKYAQYRNGGDPQTFGSEAVVIFGTRALGCADVFTGSILDARIYPDGLTAEQIASLKPATVSGPKPWAWWTFEDGTCKDHMGRFSTGKPANGPVIQNGMLVLNGKGSVTVEQISGKK